MAGTESHLERMSILEQIDGLSECIEMAIRDHLAKVNIEWPFNQGLHQPILRIEAFLEEKAKDSQQSPRSEKIASRTLDLTGFVTPAPSQSPPTTTQEVCSAGDPLPSNEDLHKEREEPAIVRKNLRRKPSREPDDAPTEHQRRGIGGLRIAPDTSIEDSSEHQRRIQSDNRSFPKRRKAVSEKFVFQPSTLDKLVIGIWEQIHGTLSLDLRAIFEQFQISSTEQPNTIQANPVDSALTGIGVAGERGVDTFSKMNAFCRRVTQASRVCRSIEIIVQARWIELFEEQIQIRVTKTPELSAAKHRKAVFMEACQDFGWSEKELRNKMAVWRGYKEVKDAAGWAALVFAGMGIYRFCKYRVGFDDVAMRRLNALRHRLEVAADTLHPRWRQILSIIGEPSTNRYTGHPHDWVVFEDGSEPVPLRTTYLENDPHFDFEQIDDSIIDRNTWGCDDPRWVPQSNVVTRPTDTFLCAACSEAQSDDPKSNSCYCFPKLFGCVKRISPPVQVFRTADGRNNGLLALTTFERGATIGEFVGLVTKGIRHLDVMDSSTSTSKYQIWQGRQGNYTRFVNHSCKANAQFSQFNWLDTQHVILVSKGIGAGAEITVDYSDRYWSGLDKSCLCGESCCRYRRGE